ncbi:MAG: carboxypeptidase regulatory-like domain-containing protein [Bacteroides sp.]|nr:carboxypeptidase regulatory-like domain-containing protein [Bacteroides sp.]
MKKHVKLGVYVLLGMALTSAITACHDNDPDYSNVTPPTVAVTYSISGVVTGIDGEGLTATVSMDDTSITTNADGTFRFDNINPGTYTLKAEASGKEPKETTITVSNEENSMNPVWNVALSNLGTEVVSNEDGSASGSVVSETLKGNEAGEIEMKVTASSGTVETGTQIIITPLYSIEEVGNASTRQTSSTGSTLLIGTRISCTDASATLQEPMKLEYDIDAEVAKTVVAQKYVDGNWVDAEYTVDNNIVTVTADRFTAYSLLCIASISSTESTETIAFTPNSWDNLYGSDNVSVESASYSYKIGVEINSSDTSKIASYLIEILARETGSGFVTSTGTYPLNVTLPIGTAMSISGSQAVTSLTASAWDVSATAKQYGTVSVITRTWNRQHTGGSSGNSGM